jgi:hypothetical protein
LILSAIAILVNLNRDFTLIHRLSDGFFIGGSLLLCVGGLKFARNAGTFDMMTFGLKSALHMTLPWIRSNSPLERKNEDFVAYKARKKEARKPARNTVLTGLAFTALAAILFAIYVFTK